MILTGDSLLSEFRLANLNRQLAALGLQLQSATELFLVQWAIEPAAAQLNALHQLLDASEVARDQAAVLIVPRLGTVSPWSSKASDIARVCGIAQLRRLEHGRELKIAGWQAAGPEQRAAALALLYDPLTESWVESLNDALACFSQHQPEPVTRLALGDDPAAALQQANERLGLALSAAEIEHLANFYAAAQRDPSDAELMMFAQINSEHCRHKIFNARWQLDGQAYPHSLFDMIRMTYAATPTGILSAYKDNAAVLAAAPTTRMIRREDGQFVPLEEAAAIAIKVETHNHPTAIAPDPGAATGSGGEIRDEAATGRGGKPKAGLCGFSVGDLRIPDHGRAWEGDDATPARLASPLDIMLQGPIGAARYNNEFGRPNLCGYFRSMDMQRQGRRWGYAKPIMIAGGIGSVRPMHAQKQIVAPGALVVILGGPGMLIGLGGGAASSVHAGASSEALDFASVQRANPEMERRCQEVIDACWTAGEDNPIRSIHDVGAGGLSNAVPEILNDNDLGGDIDLAAVLTADSGMSPMEIWCNESQERYVIALDPADLPRFEKICQRERCPFAVIGTGTAEPQLRVRYQEQSVVDMPMAVLLGKQLPLQLSGSSLAAPATDDAALARIPLAEAIDRVLRVPAVASKAFLITIGDRSVTGLVCRDQMVGRWQVPVADVAVTAAGFAGDNGEAMAMGERSPLAIWNAPASGRMAVAEALTNLAAAPIEKIEDVRLSANWMAAAGDVDQSSALLATVETVGRDFCPALGLAIPVGKDSLSMQTRWQHAGEEQSVTSPVSLVISAFAPVLDVARVLTPELQLDSGASEILLLELGGQWRLGGSALAQAFDCELGDVPDCDDAPHLRALFELIQKLRQQDVILAYHDRSDGGLLACLLEMAFAARCGLEIILPEEDLLARLFAEEIGIALQVPESQVAAVIGQAAAAGLCATVVARPVSGREVKIVDWQGQKHFCQSLVSLQQAWADTSYRLQALRDDPACAAEEFGLIADLDHGGLQARFDGPWPAPAVVSGRPPVAILREQGVNGQLEMAWMFEQAGFTPIDVHMSELIAGERTLSDYVGLAACGGFSYGDVLGAGRGWAKTILLNAEVRAEFERFFAAPGTFALGVCNGCQMLSSLAEIIPGADLWPRFVGNRSEQFEARLAQVEIPGSDSIMLASMAGALLPIAAAHGEGRAEFAVSEQLAQLESSGRVAMRYVDSQGQATEQFPLNPNGSPRGVTGLTAADGRVTIMMPHPERLTRAASFSWAPKQWQGSSPWLQMFLNARQWLGDS